MIERSTGGLPQLRVLASSGCLIVEHDKLRGIDFRALRHEARVGRINLLRLNSA